jgi:Flp pilus assembly protein TadG
MITSKKGQALVEFALVFPVLFFLLALTIDLFRVDWVTSTVAEAARQGARQAVANADPNDNPFGTASGSCSGTSQVNAANGSGCLTSTRVYQTVVAVLGGFSSAANLSEASPANCPNPTVGHASICIYPTEQGPAGSYANCAAARSSLGRDPVPGDLGARAPEYASPQYKGCFPIVVTVIYRYDTLAPFLGTAAPNFLRIASSTAMVAEY